MEEERFFTGYCRQIDGSRTVTTELDNGMVTHADCSIDVCIYRQSCPIAKQIDGLRP